MRTAILMTLAMTAITIYLKVDFAERLRLLNADCLEKVDTLMITDYLCWTGKDFARCDPEQVVID